MPYSDGKIYKIVCNETGEVYVGSCICDLDTRLSKHKTDRDCSAIEILDRNNYQMLLIENYPCKTRRELLWRERYWFENIKCINKNRPIVTEEEKKQKHKMCNQKHSETYKERKKYLDKKRRQYKASWGYNNYLGTSLNLLDIDTSLFER